MVQPDGQVSPLSPSTRAAIQQLKDEWSSQGKRVILLARKVVNMDIGPDALSSEMEVRVLKQVSGGLTFVGLLALLDPPRSDIPEVMRTLRGAGIRNFMVCPPGISVFDELLTHPPRPR